MELELTDEHLVLILSWLVLTSFPACAAVARRWHNSSALGFAKQLLWRSSHDYCEIELPASRQLGDGFVTFLSDGSALILAAAHEEHSISTALGLDLLTLTFGFPSYFFLTSKKFNLLLGDLRHPRHIDLSSSRWRHEFAGADQAAVALRPTAQQRGGAGWVRGPRNRLLPRGGREQKYMVKQDAGHRPNSPEYSALRRAPVPPLPW